MVCRAPPGAEAASFSVGPPAGDSEAAAVAWDAFWGFDCVAQRGLCDVVYSHLGIAQSSWQALKMLPAVSPPHTALWLSSSCLSWPQLYLLTPALRMRTTVWRFALCTMSNSSG